MQQQAIFNLVTQKSTSMYFYLHSCVKFEYVCACALRMRQTKLWNNSQSISVSCCRWDKSLALRSDYLCSRESDGYKAGRQFFGVVFWELKPSMCLAAHLERLCTEKSMFSFRS